MNNALSYQKLSEIDHVLHRSSMYGADTVFTKRKDEYVAIVDNDDIRCKLSKLYISDALERIFLEILSNAGDNVINSRDENIDPGVIRIQVDGKSVSIYNEGLHIPVEIHPDEGVYIAEMIFGMLRTGSNYDDDKERVLVGQNGVGAKLSNIFSSEFTVECGDPVNGTKIIVRFSNNMKSKDAPIISEYYDDKGYTKITFTPDFDRLYEGEDTLKAGGIFTDDFIALYRKYALDVAYSCKVPVYFNDIEINITNIKDYTSYFVKNIDIPNDPIVIEYKNSSLCLYDVPNNNRSISIVNGVNTKRGGIHVESWMKTISRPIIDHYKKKKKIVTTDMIKKNIIMFLSCRVDKPKYSSQSKELLTSPKVPTNFKKEYEATLLKWDIVDRIGSMIDSKDEIEMKKIDGKKTTYIDLVDVDEANCAGTKNSTKCSIFITEGKSAKTSAVRGIQHLEGGRDIYGALPIRGKFININNKDMKKVAGNKEVQILKKVLGLREGVDYEDDKEFNTLRYGSVIIFADADVDGIHIRGLLMNFFMTLYPSLLKRGFVKVMLSPIIKVKKGSTELEFSNSAEYTNWKKSEKDYESWSHKYFKGLGTHTADSVMKMFSNPIIFPYPYDDLAETSMNMAFGEKQEGARKQWIEGYDLTKEMTPWKDATLTTFVREELVEYSLETIQRAIPLYMDGLKESQRKILHIFLKYPNKEERLVPWSGLILAQTNYHHGDASLQETIKKMAQDFPGSNNIPLIHGEGEFGTRLEGGADAASARYISAKLASITKWIFRQEDNCILKYRMDEGKKIEPYEFYPIIPPLLINGAHGVAVGWSTSIPSYNPKDIISWIRRWLKIMLQYKNTDSTSNREPMPDLIPWYKGYRGKIYRNNKGKIINEGVFEHKSDRITYITAIPISKNILKYKEDTIKMKEENKIVNHRHLSNADATDIRIIGMTKPTLAKLKLKSQICISNITTIDKDGKPTIFRNVNDYLEYFCANRLMKYEYRKKVRLEQLKQLIPDKLLFIKFVDDVITRKLDISMKYDNLVKELKKRKYPETFLDKKIRNLTEKKKIFLQEEVENIKKECKEYERDPSEIWLKEIDELEKHL